MLGVAFWNRLMFPAGSPQSRGLQECLWAVSAVGQGWACLAPTRHELGTGMWGDKKALAPLQLPLVERGDRH